MIKTNKKTSKTQLSIKKCWVRDDFASARPQEPRTSEHFRSAFFSVRNSDWIDRSFEKKKASILRLAVVLFCMKSLLHDALYSTSKRKLRSTFGALFGMTGSSWNTAFWTKSIQITQKMCYSCNSLCYCIILLIWNLFAPTCLALICFLHEFIGFVENVCSWLLLTDIKYLACITKHILCYLE